jgi:sugar phosphate isomerase/epimerase
MFRNLSPGAIGIGCSTGEAMDLAKQAGFEGVDVNVGELMQNGSPEEARKQFDDAGLRPGPWGLPINWRGEESLYQQQLKALEPVAEFAAAMGAPRTATFIPSWSDEMPFATNFEFHVSRFRPIAEALAKYDCRLGLEFLGPKTLRDGHPYPFIHTLEGMLELCRAIDTGNVGLLLDAWHWYTSHGTMGDLKALSDGEVVCVHINDAPQGVEIDEQIDNVRCLPGETGVIDLAGFLGALQHLRYTGPVTPEPFSAKLKSMPAAKAASATGKALRKVWEAGLGN